MARTIHRQLGPDFVAVESSLLSLNLDIDRFLYHDVQRTWQDVQSLTMQRDHFAIDHHVNGGVEMEINTTHFAHLGERMLDMRAVIKARQVADQPDTPDWSPTYEFDEAVINF